MYDELVKALRFIARQQCRVEGEQTAICDIVADAIEKLSKPRWIPVNEALPEAGERVLCYCRANIFEVMKMRTDGAWVHNDKVCDSAYMSGFVTHWMPLPPAPKEGE